jgi:hypothetical protein
MLLGQLEVIQEDRHACTAVQSAVQSAAQSTIDCNLGVAT